jgi:hypothetical protein
MPWNPMESNSIFKYWNGIGIKVNGIGLELKIQNFSITTSLLLMNFLSFND